MHEQAYWQEKLPTALARALRETKAPEAACVADRLERAKNLPFGRLATVIDDALGLLVILDSSR
jgi:hypothetical protein